MKIQKRVIIYPLLFIMFCTSVLSDIPADKDVQIADAKEREGNYVVIMKSENEVEAVCNKYEDVLDVCLEDNPDELSEEGILVADMSDSEAEKLEADKMVLSVEENFTLEGSRAKKHARTGKKVHSSNLMQKGIEYVDAGQNDNWNLETIHAADADDETVEEKNKVRVAILDSGVDMLDNIQVKERINFIPGQENFTVMFEDEAGHGTAVAGIIAGETMEGETTEGINKNVEIYSAKVLDENNQAPLSRIIQGIYWAIEQDVHIINMSFGTDRYSQALEDAVKAASDKGILIVAAAGNQGKSGTDTVEYPAAFSEVIAVGSVDAQGEVSDFSAKGEELEVVAPGEAVRVTGAFGADMVVSGTSMAAPHVTAVASLLWGKNLSKSANFIRTLLDESARSLGSETESGFGLIDYKYAEQMYDVVERQMEKNQEVNVPENDARIQVFDNSEDVEKLEEGEKEKEDGEVKGSWRWGAHTKYLDDKNINLPAMKQGAVYPDREESGTQGMKAHPEFHGYFRNESKQSVNYVACYHFMLKIADAYGKGKDYLSVSKCKGLSDASYNAIRQGFNKMNKKIKSFSQNKDRKAFVYGIAMHTATDVFSHSTLKYVPYTWVRIKHKPINEADDPAIEPRRFTMAYRVQRNNIYRFQGKRDDVPICHDFHAAGDTDGTYYYQGAQGPYYKAIRLEFYAQSAGVTNKTVLNHFQIISQDYDGK